MGGKHTRDRFRTERSSNHGAGLFGILGGNAARNSHHLEALAREPSVAPDVMLDPAGMLMNFAIDLDDQSAFQADEIDHERPDRVLAAKPQSPLLPAAQNLP